MLPNRKQLTCALAALALGACSSLPDTPHGQYLKTDQAYQVTLDMAKAYVRACNATPETNPCHGTKPAIEEALNEASAAFDEADVIMNSPNVTHYHLALVAAEKAYDNLAKAYLKRNPL